ncbi:unnamed protein product, partial [Allacma fusca]
GRRLIGESEPHQSLGGVQSHNAGTCGWIHLDNGNHGVLNSTDHNFRPCISPNAPLFFLGRLCLLEGAQGGKDPLHDTSHYSNSREH